MRSVLGQTENEQRPSNWLVWSFPIELHIFGFPIPMELLIYQYFYYKIFDFYKVRPPEMLSVLDQTENEQRP